MKQFRTLRLAQNQAFSLPHLLWLLLLAVLSPGYAWAADPIKLEAESATLTGVSTATSYAGYSGTGYAWGFDNAADNVLFTFSTAAAGQYDVVIRYISPYGDKGYGLAVNGTSANKTFTGSGTAFGTTTAGRYTLVAGQNTVRITNGWGYYGIDYLELVPVSVAPAPVVPLVNGRAEAELGVLSGVSVSTTPAGYSGTGVVTGFDDAADNVIISFQATAGLYKLSLGYNSPYGDKGYDLKVNGESSAGMLTANGSRYNEAAAGTYLLKEGLNTVVIGRGWGYYNIDYVQLTPTTVALPAAVPATLADAKATPATQALFGYLRSQYGTKVLAGQHADPQNKLSDIQYIIDKTGKEPALGSFDLIEYSPSRIQYGSNPTGHTEQYLAWAAKDQGRGIVSLMWHWNAPTDLINSASIPWWKGFYTEGTTFDLAAVMADTTGARYQLLLRDIDAIAVELKKFQAANIPVLWRPLHEAPGKFFWWGAKGATPYKALWRMLYKRLTNHHQLHNLIWVYSTTQSPSMDWYPGDAYVDISGVDLYLNPTASMSGDWNGLQGQYGANKLVALTESGNLPDPDKIRAYATWWSWFNIWSSADFIRKQPLELLQRVYNDRDIITRDELPNWRDLFAPLTLATTQREVSCPGGTDGSITATFGSGSSTYQVKLGATAAYQTQASPFTFANLGAGTYTVYVKDAAGKEVSQEVTLGVSGVAPVVSIAVSRADQTPTGGTAQTIYLGYGAQQLTLTAADASSAAAGTTYSWSPDLSLNNVGGATALFAPTQAGTYTYTVTATSSTGCTATQGVALTVIDVRCGPRNEKISVCHKGRALCIAASAVEAHLAHGDQLGDCTTATSSAKSTAAAQSTASDVAASLTIDQAPVFEAYPNPFAEQAVLHFRTASAGQAQLLLYNTLGQVVATLYNGPVQAGQDYQVPVVGTALAAGLYTGRLVVDGHTQTIRLLLDKYAK